MDPKKKQNLEETYIRILNVALCIVPYEDLSGLVAPEPMLFGTTKDEKVFSFSELDEMFKSQYEQMAGFVPSLDRKRLSTLISKDGNNAIIGEEVAVTLSSPEAINNIFVRLSCVMEYIDSQWKLTHWHGSTPVETENDHWHMEEWKREKEKLQNLVDQQTADLHGKNRELEIEASIERVRAVTMGMTKPDDMLKVCRVISDQLQQFGVEHIRNVQTVIINEEKGTYHNYQYFTPYDKESFEITECHKNPTVQAMIDRMLESPDAFFNTSLAGEKLATFRSYRKKEKQFPDPLLDDTKSLNGYFFSIGPGGLGITLYRPLNEDGLEIFKRFHNVFSLAYRRFRDIEQAEAQAREAEIQLALERVRARTMAMQNSDELMEVSMELFSQFKSLGALSDQFSIAIFDTDRQKVKVYATLDGEKFDKPSEVERDNHEVISEFWNSWRSNKKSMTIDLTGESLASYNSMRNSIISTKGEKAFSGDRWVIHAAFFSYGFLSFSSAKHHPPETLDLLERFAKVFEQTYTRFLDLQKSEEQAREAQIEAALERVRSRSMGMQKSSDLRSVVDTLYGEFKRLGLIFDNVVIQLLLEDTKDFHMWITSEDGLYEDIIHWPYVDLPVFHEFYEARIGNKSINYRTSSEAETREFFEEYFKLDAAPQERKSATKQVKSINNMGTYQEHTGIFLMRYTEGEYSEKDKEIVRRFSKVFEQTYTRFLDLQQAEAQTRESEIQLSLERVRARSMAMHQSDELADLSLELVKQVHALGIDTWFCAFNIYDDHPEGSIEWGSNGQGTFPRYRTPREGVFLDYYEAGQRGETLLINEISEDECPAHYDYLCSLPGVGDQLLKMKDEGIPFPTSQIDHVAFFKYGYILFITFEPVPEDHDIFKRFAKVFQQTYTRFLDLQKSEEQAREAKIEAALERVRARSMGMHKSDELIEVVREIGRGIQELGIHTAHSQIFTDYSFDPKDGLNTWVDVPGQNYLEKFHIPYVNHRTTKNFYTALDKGLNFFSDNFSKSEKDSYFESLFKYSDLKNIPQERKDLILSTPGWTRFTVILEGSSLHFGRYTLEEEFTNEEKEIIKRFGKVFGQAYTRFLDLKKAEAQAREAQIEAALEKVRSRSMAMHNSQELKEVALELRKQMGLLGQKDLEVCAIHLYGNDEDSFESWSAMKASGSETKIVQTQAHFPKRGIRIVDEMMHHYTIGTKDYVLVNEGEKITEWFKVLKKHAPELHASILDSIGKVPVKQLKAYWAVAEFSGGALVMVTYGEPDEVSRNLLRRSANVFEQAYVRFLDLQKAEDQAREAQIEAALERVRSRTMGMQNSEELAEVIAQINAEITNLGIRSDNTTLITDIKLNEKSGSYCTWFSIPGKTYSNKFLLPKIRHPLYERTKEAYQKKIEFFTLSFTKKEKNRYLNFAFAESDLKFLPEERKEFLFNTPGLSQSVVLHKNSGLALQRFSNEAFSEEENAVAIRFGRVFEQTYTRFIDLQKAEAQAIEATKQASLDRVRGEIASMRSAKDLEIITPLIWNELTTLGIPFIRCGVFIIHEEDEQVEVYLSKPDGTSLAVMHLPFDSSELAIQTVEAWQNGRVYTQHWTQEEFLDWGRSMMEQGQVPDLKTYQGAEEAPESLHLQFLPFNQGMLYVGSTNPLDEEEISLSESLAKAFSIAYARYEDFVKLEKAKVGIEEALTELKATQSQLVQQEKLASLGQLTAGIAHEIKNPLNFVNNFSEVSIELVQEARKEVLSEKAKGKSEKGKTPFEGGAETIAELGDVTISAIDETTSLILEILDDIEANLRKIHEHGTRADGIVKSMLQHSRGGDGKMEPSPLNPLIKEFVNLAFHGMRASKEPINVDIDLQLDESVGEVPLIAEDFSRVILNLCNNAFDAMRDKQGAGHKVQGAGGYEPKLTVRTKSLANAVTIEIEDNGPGIPDEIKDKIMQPFFTTKKGTQGTGLGLSITNDIIKAHGATLDIDSKPGRTIFIIKFNPSNP